MRIASNWRLTFDPTGVTLVLLDYGQHMEGELKFPWSKGLEVVDLADAAAPFLRPTGNDRFSIRMDVYSTAANDATARRNLLEALVAAGSTSRKPLKLEVKGITDRHWLFANAFITELDSSMVVTGAVARYLKSYMITATGLSQVGP